jgi:hypothetical protein
LQVYLQFELEVTKSKECSRLQELYQWIYKRFPSNFSWTRRNKMFRTPGKDNLPPEGGNRQNGDIDEESEDLQSNKSGPSVTSTPAIKPPKVIAVTTEIVEETDKISSTASTTHERPLQPTPVAEMEGMERPVPTKGNVMQSAKAENTARTVTKLIGRSTTQSEVKTGKRKSVLPRQSLEEEDDSIIARDASMIAPLLFSGKEQTQSWRRSVVRDRVDRLNQDHRTATPDRQRQTLESAVTRTPGANEMKWDNFTVDEELSKVFQIMIVLGLFQARQVCVNYMKIINNFSQGMMFVN